MRNIRSEDHISADAVRGTGGRSSLPTVAPYTPNYKGVNQVLMESPGSAEVGFMNSLAHMSSQYIAEQQELYDNMEVSEALSNVDVAYNQASEEFLRENQTGKGYMEFATGKYRELGGAALTTASNAKVKERLQQMFTLRRANIATSAFQKEKEMYTGYALSQTELQLTRTLNEVADNPDQAVSLEGKLEQQLQPMKNILAAQEFEKYHREMMQQFVYFQGMGTIKKHPFQAEKLIQSEYYKSQLSPNNYLHLQKSATQEREHQEHEAKIYQALQESALNQQRIRNYQNDIELPMLLEGKTKSDAEIIAMDLTMEQKIKAIKETHAFKEKIGQELVTRQNIDKALIQDEFPEEMTASQQEKYLTNLFKGNESVKIGENSYSVQTQTEQAFFMKKFANTFQYRYEPLIRQTTTNIRYGKDEKQIMDACAALATFHDIPALKGIDEDIVDFSIIASQMYAGNQDINAVFGLRDTWFNTPKETREANKARWQENFREKYDNSNTNLCRDFYMKNELFGASEGSYFPPRFSSEFESVDKQRLNDIVISTKKKIFARTGNETLADIVTAQRIKNIVKEVDGKWVINPPTPDNTGLGKNVIKNITSYYMQEAVDAAISAGAPIKRIGDYVPKGASYYASSSISTPDAGKIEIKGTGINALDKDKGSKRQLYLEWSSNDPKAPVYVFYYLADPSDSTSREYLYGADGTKLYIDFRKFRRRK
ncbi:MAG: hypothetical protein IJ730_07150 [Alphaproteobacteria bacterium]|nr:hypothetical protein [Alphaproteobacteria bacterium]